MKEKLELLLSQAREARSRYGCTATAANLAMLQDAIARLKPLCAVSLWCTPPAAAPI